MAAVASHYARAFADVVFDLKLDAKQVTEELRAMAELFQANLELRRVWESPAVPADQKLKLLDTIAQLSGILRPVRDFIAVVIDHDRISALAVIARQFQTEMNLRLGIVEAEVTSARTLSEPERQQLLSEVSRVTGKQVSAQYKIDLSLLGGATIRVGSTVYDGSVLGQLEKMKEQLSAG